ncbi:outer membrane beta-barrel protein [Alcanivorax sp. 1008]|nr:outer membrane beta-barrel protein [Alcanivorax sp. 1008]MCC1496676.1 outer membrane beta-barrel protein [Alcanivorax sp. 1008]
MCAPALVMAEEWRVQVADPYIDIHTGPGRGYPVFNVAEQGAWVTLIKRRTQWIKVRTPRGQTGWVHRQQLARTLDETGNYVALEERSLEDFFRPHGELGVMVGELDNTTSLTVHGGYAFTENLQLDLMWTEAAGSFANTRLINLGLQHHLYPRWRISPYVLIGAGSVRVEPRTVLVKSDIRSERGAHAGLGLRIYLTREFLLRTEYRNYVVLTTDNNNDEFEEWRTGFSVLF